MRARPFSPAVAVLALVAASGATGVATATTTAGAAPTAPGAQDAPTVRADFDNDGFEDLAVGSAWEDVGTVDQAGSVHVLFGTAGGLTGTGSQIFHQGIAGITGDPGTHDWFGWSLGTGDFDADGFTDLAIGVRNERVGTAAEAGVVHVLYGSASGLQATGSQRFNQDSPGIGESVEAFDNFGVSLATADFDGDGADDLAIGADGDPVDGRATAGVAHVLYGDPVARLSGTGSTLLSQSGAAVPEDPEAGDLFGFSLAAADYDADGFADLAVGVPSESVGTVARAGAVNVFEGSAGGVTTAGSRFLSQETQGVGSAAEIDDAFAAALAGGDFDGDGFDDLAVGASNDGVGTVAGAGVVNTLRGSATGLTGTGGQLLHQDVGAIGSTAERLDTFGAALAAGDFDADGADDLAIGVPAEAVGTVAMAGVVNVLYGVDGAGLSVTRTQMLQQGSLGLGSTPELRDELGFSLASADFNGDGRADLAAGAAFESVNAIAQGGAFHVLPGTASGLTRTPSQLFTQDSPGIESAAEPGDAFGFSLAALGSNVGS